MSEDEAAINDAYGRQEETDREPRRRHFLGLGLPRQVRDKTAAPPPTDGSGVLDLTTDSLIAISLAKALASNVPGIGYGPVQLRVEPAPRADD